MKILIFFLVASCGHFHNQPLAVKKAKHFVSPNEKVDVEILIEKSNKHNPQSYMGRMKLHSGTDIPTHNHKYSDEYLYFTQGGGVLIIEDKKYEVKSGMSFYIPMGMKHSYKNASKKSAHAIQMYTPSGPEQRFKDWE